MNKSDTFLFYTALKSYPLNGNLVYEYNPFYNYRLSKDMISYKNRLWEMGEFANELGVNYNETTNIFYKDDINNPITSWNDIIPPSESPPIVYLSGQLVDFETDELHFSPNNPIEILPLYSYDNSVNLIINDGINPPRLINSRFSATEGNKYLVCNRKGNNDSNIYDLGELFDIDTSLYKKITTIPELRFLGIGYGGNLSIGNYHFYFRYTDDDGNYSDFFSESGLVSIFIGNSANSIYSGFRDENSHKLVKFALSNTDPGYNKVVVYYTKSTSDIYENQYVLAFLIDRKYTLNNTGSSIITITGFEETLEVDLAEINPTYLIYGSAATLASALNMLFLGNVDKPKIPYEDLADCALRFLPYIDNSEIYNLKQIDENYLGSITNTYYDPNYIYNKVGYHCDEIYRFGIVFILSDNTLSDVFNVRGALNVPHFNELSSYSLIEFKLDGTRNYINFDELYYNIISEDSSSSLPLENSKGVIYIRDCPFNTVIGIKFAVEQLVIDYLKGLGIKGYFFVRLKRIPTTLCLAYTIGIDKQSNTPVIPNEGRFETESFLSLYKENNTGSEAENSRILEHDVENRRCYLDEFEVRNLGAICPEYDINASYLNTLFTGTDFVCKKIQLLSLTRVTDNHYVLQYPDLDFNISSFSANIIGVEDNVKLVAINNDLFSARAGEAEEAFRYEYIGRENTTTTASNLLRGSYGPYLGLVGDNTYGNLITIKIPGYTESNMLDYFQIRYHDKSPFYAISSRFDLSNSKKWSHTITIDGLRYEHLIMDSPLYRGDCYICLFTHRLNRNFLDPSSPTNDKIVDPRCWKDHYEVLDGVVSIENFDEINLGDVNAIKLGLYITLFVRSTFNLNIRAIDNSIPDELSLFGHPRGFFPNTPMSNDGIYKISEALCINKGFEKSLSEKLNFEVPDVPWVKNEFSNRICYSDPLIKNAFSNGWRTFLGLNYRDYPKTYGSITKIVELRGNLLCVFEHGVVIIPINERAIAGEGAGGSVYINTSNVLPENPKVLSDTFGSQWKDSVIKTPRAVYGVDTIGKKIWRTNGESFECISDFKVLHFLNLNISLTERELIPVIGVRNVKSHFNRFKNDVMFTFYDNLYGFEEKAWNLCWNEDLLQWITFYSWVPSYSENIYNQYFSFDRNTSKWITKLGVSLSDNSFSDGVVLSNNTIPNDAKAGDRIGELKLANRTLPEGEGVNTTIYYTLERDNYKNYKNFQIKYEVYTIENGTKEYTGKTLTLDLVKNGVDKDTLYDSNLYLTTDASNLCSELYVRGSNLEITTLETIRAKKGQWEKLSESKYRVYEDSNHTLYTDYDSKVHRCKKNEKDGSLEVTLNFCTWLNNCVINSNYPIYKDDRGRRINLSTIDKDRRLNGDKVVTLLNIRANILVTYNGETPSLAEAYTSGFKNGTEVNAGYYESVVAVIPLYNMLFLTTDFWKHGQAGIIDIADKIYPTYWYGKQHPFEFEFVVADNPSAHKIFDNLQIISNNAEPESFHYEIVGDCYNFAKDKKNMYIRLEATKELYQYNGCDVTYDHEYSDLDSEHRPLLDSDGNEIPGFYDRSTLMPLYYSRQDIINEIEDSYHLKDDVPTKDFSALAGGEIAHYKTLDEYRIWNHAKAVDMLTHPQGRLRGNMLYNEDKWLVQINPINIVLKNELDWSLGDLTGNSNCDSDKVPVELGQSPIPNDVLYEVNDKGEYIPKKGLNVPEDMQDRAIVSWGDMESQNKEIKLKDKWIKIRIRYTGNKLAIITAIRTLYSISYS